VGVSVGTGVAVAVAVGGTVVAVAVGGAGVGDGVLVGTAVTLAVCGGTAPHAANIAHTTVPINKRLNCRRMSLCVLMLMDQNGTLAKSRSAL
jgi:hypothetical protein